MRDESLNIKEIEARLEGDKLSLQEGAQLQYLLANKDLLAALQHFYSGHAWRRLQFMRFVSRQKRDSRFCNLFAEYFGQPEDVIVVWGQNYTGGRTFKGYTPTSSGQHFKQLLLRRGYYVFDVCEYWTSQKCHACGQFVQPAEGREHETGRHLRTNRLMRCSNRNCSV